MSDTIVEVSNGLKFKISGNDDSGDERYIQKNRLSGEEYTPTHFELSPADTVIDIGAHRGRFAVYAASRALGGGKVYAFEPQPENLARLKENIELNGFKNITVSSVAIADSRKKLLLHTNADSARSSIYGNSQVSVEIDCIPLSEVFEKNNIQRCNFLKLDCEGAEFEILFALPRTYFTKIDKIVLEFHDHLSPEKKMFDLFRMLTTEGYLLSARWGAFYTGLLFARKVHTAPFVLLVLNYCRVYIWNLGWFCAELLIKRLTGIDQPSNSQKKD